MSSRRSAQSAAGRGGEQRLLGRHPDGADGERDAKGHAGRVARAGVAVGRDGHVHAGVDRAAGVGAGLAGREVGGGQERRDGAAAGQRGDVVVREVGAWSTEAAPGLAIQRADRGDARRRS
jgi:hypothetical protein